MDNRSGSPAPRKMTVTISRQVGSLGEDIARIAAASLGYRFIYREVIHAAARQAGTPEAALAAIDELGLLSICPTEEDCLAYRQAMQQIMDSLADEGGAVILGRAGQVILRERQDVLHVRLVAPILCRVERIAQRQNISLKSAQAQVTASDRYRRNYLKRFYEIRWDDPDYYDLIINTGRLSADRAAALICQAVTLHMQE